MLKEFCLRKVSKTILESFKVLLNNNTSKIENRENLSNLGATKTVNWKAFYRHSLRHTLMFRIKIFLPFNFYFGLVGFNYPYWHEHHILKNGNI